MHNTQKWQHEPMAMKMLATENTRQEMCGYTCAKRESHTEIGASKGDNEGLSRVGDCAATLKIQDVKEM